MSVQLFAVVVFSWHHRVVVHFFVGTAFDLHVARMESGRTTQFLAKKLMWHWSYWRETVKNQDTVYSPGLNLLTRFKAGWPCKIDIGATWVTTLEHRENPSTPFCVKSLSSTSSSSIRFFSSPYVNHNLLSVSFTTSATTGTCLLLAPQSSTARTRCK
jgi:hypothetical protein